MKKMGRSWDDIPNDYATIKDLDRQAVKYFLDNRVDTRVVVEETFLAPS